MYVLDKERKVAMGVRGIYISFLCLKRNLGVFNKSRFIKLSLTELGFILFACVRTRMCKCACPSVNMYACVCACVDAVIHRCVLACVFMYVHNKLNDRNIQLIQIKNNVSRL